ncbi:MAG TPA: integrase [Puia sp.]|nr:integrase [Puia sp.]
MICKTYHDSPITGHPGQHKTNLLIKNEYYWPGMTRYINNYVKGCAICQQMKPDTHPLKHPLTPIKSEVTRPFQQVTMDFITDLPPSNGFDSIMVVVDHGLSKGVIYIPTTKKGLDAKKTLELYIDNVWKRFGWPKIIISDCGPQFSSQMFQDTAKAMGINSRMSTAFHPQTDGETERVNQELEIYLRIYCGLEPERWSSYLSMAEFAHNIKVHDATKNTPFNIILGTEPIGIPSAIPRFNSPTAEEKTRELQKI